MAVDFGYVINLGSNSPEGGPTLADDNRRALRALGGPVNTFWVEDHFQFGETPLLECWTALSMFAAEFPSLRMGTIVMSQSYRNPAALAKMAAVLQFMSGGRLIFGIGAGWKEDEYRAYGYPFPAPAVRIAQLDEAIQIAKKMWTETPATFEGKHYAIHDAICTPRPNPVPPILVGGGGEQLTMRVVAKHADWWNIGFRNVEEYARKLAILKEHCAKIGRDPSTIKLSYYAQLQVSRDPARIKKHDRLYQVAGTPDQVAAELQQFIDLGVTHIMFRPSDFPSLESIETLQQDVIPRLRLDG
jgi:alkanesulfonate monooxygenase SsuD/methylene tetrahydromethanopterin reductase-like flavin-dependent oxidoreductase (luciferase family)